MRYFICGLTINGGHFWVNDVYEYKLNDEYSKMVATIAYFGGGSITVYEVDYTNEVAIKSFEKIHGNVDIPVDNEVEYQ